MATEYPRQHVWSGDSGSQLTWLVNVGPELGTQYKSIFYLVKSLTSLIAIAATIAKVLPIPDEWNELVILCRPLNAYETDRVSLKDGEIIELDDDSYKHLTINPTDTEEIDSLLNGEDDDDREIRSILNDF